eukprot:9825192-Prorocentrum_lima.AAC.1
MLAHPGPPPGLAPPLPRGATPTAPPTAGSARPTSRHPQAGAQPTAPTAEHYRRGHSGGGLDTADGDAGA